MLKSCSSVIWWICTVNMDQSCYLGPIWHCTLSDILVTCCYMFNHTVSENRIQQVKLHWLYAHHFIKVIIKETWLILYYSHFRLWCIILTGLKYKHLSVAVTIILKSLTAKALCDESFTLFNWSNQANTMHRVGQCANRWYIWNWVFHIQKYQSLNWN